MAAIALRQLTAYLIQEIPRREDPGAGNGADSGTARRAPDPGRSQRLAALLAAYHAGVAAAAGMWAAAPRETGDGRVDAAFAAMAEHLARRDGWIVPTWARLPEREAWPWWFVTDLRGLHPQALVESPSSFRRRGVFITSGALDRA